MNPDWNYGYLHDEGYGEGVSADPVNAALSSISAITSAITGVVGMGISAKTQREQAKADERMARLSLLQSAQDTAASKDTLAVSLAQSTQQAEAQKSIAKTVILGLGGIVLIGGMLWLGKDLLKEP